MQKIIKIVNWIPSVLFALCSAAGGALVFLSVGCAADIADSQTSRIQKRKTENRNPTYNTTCCYIVLRRNVGIAKCKNV